MIVRFLVKEATLSRWGRCLRWGTFFTNESFRDDPLPSKRCHITWSSSPSRRITYRVSELDTNIFWHGALFDSSAALKFSLQFFPEMTLVLDPTMRFWEKERLCFIMSESVSSSNDSSYSLEIHSLNYILLTTLFSPDNVRLIHWGRVSCFLEFINIGKTLLEVIIIGNFLFVDWVWLVLRHSHIPLNISQIWTTLSSCHLYGSSYELRLAWHAVTFRHLSNATHRETKGYGSVL